jgi:hemerythrin superfamily protein
MAKKKQTGKRAQPKKKTTKHRRKSAKVAGHPNQPPEQNSKGRDNMKSRGTIALIKKVSMNALEMLKQDHQKVKGLFQEASQADDQNKQKELFKKIDTELGIHANIEETIFYPALEGHDELRDMVAVARGEHEEVKALLEDLDGIGTETDEFESQLQSLMESVEHHVEEEEQKMFPKVRAIFDEKELEQLGKKLESAKGTAHRKAG